MNEVTMLQDGTYEEQIDDSFEVASLVASAAPAKPPKDWFINPGLAKPTPLTVTKDGKVFGHIATWDTNHIGMPSETKPPRSNYDYAFFKTGVVETADGDDVAVGQLTLAGGHAPLNASAGEAVEHYDDTSSSVADLSAGEDGIGIWVAGALRPGVTDEQIRALRASAPSGDWRPINGNLELVAVCQVNTPGFPVARALAASGEMMALVAAGARHMYELQQETLFADNVEKLAARVDELETIVAAAAGKRKRPFGENADSDDNNPDKDMDETEAGDSGDDDSTSDEKKPGNPYRSDSERSEDSNKSEGEPDPDDEPRPEPEGDSGDDSRGEDKRDDSEADKGKSDSPDDSENESERRRRLLERMRKASK